MLFGKKMGALPAKAAWRETEVRDGIQAKTACSRNRKPGCREASAVTDHQPLVHGKTIHHDQCDLRMSVVAHLTGKKPREVMQHDRRHWRQIDKPGVPLEEPGGKTGVHLCLQALRVLVRFPADGIGLLVHEQNQLRPSTGKVEPVRVLCVVGRNGCLQTLDELAQATGPVLDWGGSKADAYPGLGQGVRMVVWHGVQQSLDEQVVDVDPDVMVVEGQIDRSLNGQTVGLLVFTNTGCPFGCLAVEEDRPALLEECEECLPVRHQCLKRPVVEDECSDAGVG